MAARPGHDLSVRVARDLRHRLDTLDESAARVRAQRLRSARSPNGRLARAYATDAEAIHDLRVAARRLTAGLRLWAPALERKARRRSLRLLRRARRRFGPLREIEVHAAELAARAGQRAPASLIRTAEAWRERYAHDRTAALARVTPERLRTLRTHVDDALTNLTELLRDPRAVAGARRRLMGDRRAARAALFAAVNAEDSAAEVFHAARIAVKKWRYAEEQWHAAHGVESRVVEHLRKVQEALGDAHDHATLREALTAARPAKGAPMSAATRRLMTDLETDETSAVARFRGLVPRLLGRSRMPTQARKKRSIV